MNQLLDHAITWHLRGYVPLPVAPDGTKRPAVTTWKQYQATPPDLAHVLQLFDGDQVDGIGLLTGATSGNLEMVELEGRAITEGYLPRLIQAFIDHDQRPLWDRVAGGYVELTPTGGLHYHYRVAGPAARNTKLARRPPAAGETGPQVLIETRGEGGFTVIAPSGGRTHPTGKAWTVLAGGPDQIPTLTIDERDTLHAIATTLDTMPATEGWRGSATGPSDSAGGTRPGDDYNARASWDDLLIPRGWQKARSFGRDRIGWVRPGKHPRDGISATTGGAADGVSRLFVFSTSTELEAEQPYTKFAALTLLEHGGDYAAAARRLAADGYGESPDARPILTIAAHPEAAPISNVIPITGRSTPTVGATALKLEHLEPIALAGYGQTEDGMARALVDSFALDLKFCPQRGQWLTWTGGRWQWDEGEFHRERAKQIARTLPDNDAWKTFRRRALSAAGIAGIIRLARTDPAITVHIDQLDAHPWQLNTPGGIIDLRTGELTAPRREKLHTRTTTVTPDPTMPAPHWEKFLADTFNGDQALIGFVQRLLGLSLVGEVLERVLPFGVGSGANGKSTLLEIVMAVAGRGDGGYAITAPSEMLMQRKHSEHPAELAALAGARLVVCSEIDEGQRFAEARIKQLTGKDSVSARFMRGNPFTFTPSHTIWLIGNHKPTASVGGPAFWTRLKLVPFDHVIPESQRDPELLSKLEAEGPAILAWLAQGAANYNRNRLGVPAAVEAATKAYEDDQDTIGRFVDQCCHRAPGASTVAVKVGVLRDAYESFCRESGDSPASPRRFTQELRDRFAVDGSRTESARFYTGICLLADESPVIDQRSGWYL